MYCTFLHSPHRMTVNIADSFAAEAVSTCMQFCAHNFLSESALEAIEAGRAEFAAALTDMGLLPPSFRAWMQQQARSSQPPADMEVHEFDAYCSNARIVKAALCAGKLDLYSTYTAAFTCQ